MTGKELIDQLRKQLSKSGSSPPTDAALSAYLGIESARLAQIKMYEKLSPLQVSRLLKTSHESGRASLSNEAIKTLVEFFPIDAEINARGGVKTELFDTKVGGKIHKYREGLKKELEASKGVYLFYDSRGRALYAGQAKISLWREMKDAFNRNRGEVQSLSRVDHPASNVEFKRAAEKRRQIVKRDVPLWELASYFSAYSVDTSMIGDMEAFLIRAFPNDLMNKKKENMGKAGKKIAKRKSAR